METQVLSFLVYCSTLYFAFVKFPEQSSIPVSVLSSLYLSFDSRILFYYLIDFNVTLLKDLNLAWWGADGGCFSSRVNLPLIYIVRLSPVSSIGQT